MHQRTAESDSRFRGHQQRGAAALVSAEEAAKRTEYMEPTRAAARESALGRGIPKLLSITENDLVVRKLANAEHNKNDCTDSSIGPDFPE